MYSRRRLGTILISALCLFELSFFLIYLLYNWMVWIDVKSNISYLLLSLICLSKLTCHDWMLWDPTFTTIAKGQNSPRKYFMFIIVTVLTSLLAIFVEFFMKYAKKEPLTDAFGLPVLVSVLLSAEAVFEGLVYFTPEDSKSFLKNLKPWIMSKDENEDKI